MTINEDRDVLAGVDNRVVPAWLVFVLFVSGCLFFLPSLPDDADFVRVDLGDM